MAAHIVACTRYPPAGRRGAAFGFAHDDWAREYKAYGFRLFAYGLDQALLQNALRHGLAVLRQ